MRLPVISGLGPGKSRLMVERLTTSFEAARNQAPESASVPFCLYARKWLPPVRHKNELRHQSVMHRSKCRGGANRKYKVTTVTTYL